MSKSMMNEIEYEEIVEHIDMEGVLEGTQWEDSFDESEPFAEEFFGLLGEMGGYALGEVLGLTVGRMIDRELEIMDEKMADDDEDADMSDSTDEESNENVSDSSGESS